MSSNSSQLWLLLWKDYLVRKRKPITIGGVVWAAATILSLVIVRSNVYPDEKPTCQFVSRALPSAGVMPFLQSFICTINNDCNGLDEFEEIPSYNKSGLTSLQDQFLPVFQNESLMETVEVIPNALKLLSTLTRLIDNKDIHSFIYDGFKISDIFNNPQRVEVLLSDRLKARRKIFTTLLQSSINIDNVVSRFLSMDKITCDVEIFKQLLISENSEDIADVANIICNMNSKDLEKISTTLIYEINIRKYFAIIGDIINELTGKSTVNELGELFSSIIQLTTLQNYIPKEFQNGENDRKSYFDASLIQRMVTIFEPLFAGTDAYNFILSGTNTLSNSLDFISNIINSKNHGNVDNSTSIEFENSKNINFDKLIHINNQVRTTITSIVKGKTPSAFSVLDVLNGVVEITLKMLPNDSKHQFLYYMTLIDKMVSGAYNTLKINLHMEEVMFNVSVRHPKGVEKISKLGPVIVGKIIDGLTDVSRVQVLTRKIYHSAHMFCDSYKLQVFLKITKEEATRVKPIVCDSVWKNYVSDIVESFGVNNISSTINNIASFVVTETLGKDNEARFIKPQDLFYNVGTFINYVIQESIHPDNNETRVDWKSLFNYSNYDEIENVMRSKSNKTDVLLVTVNTALAREVISKNAILETYITPTLIKLKMAIKSLSKEIETIPKTLTNQIKENFISILEVILSTLNDKQKTLNILTVDQETVLCKLVEDCTLNPKTCNETLKSNKYINYPSDKDSFHLTKILCNITSAVYKKLNSDLNDDIFLNTIDSILNDTELGKGSTVDWNELIGEMQKLYIILDKNFGFILNSKANDLVNIHRLVDKLELEQITTNNIEGAFKISVSVSLSALQILDSKVFGLNRIAAWNKAKDKMVGINSLFYIANQIFKTCKALINSDERFEIDELPFTSEYIKDIVFNLPSFIKELATLVAVKDVNIKPVIDLVNDENEWPCSNSSIANIMMFNSNASATMKAIEAIFCAGETLKSEWDNFEHIGKISGLVKNSSYSIMETAHTFSMTARNFNEFINKFSDFVKSISNIQMNSENSHPNQLLTAWKYAINIINEHNVNNSIFRHTLKNIDSLLNSTSDDEIDIDFTPSRIWEMSVACTSNDSSTFKECRTLYWNAIKYTIKYVAEGGEQMVADLTEYFDQISAPNANVLQLMGFTKKTGPYIMFSKLPEFLDVVMNSFLDQGFMKQVYRSLGKKFWDCERILDNIVIPTNSKVTKSDINLIKPYVCPSFIHWVSVPINENVLLDIFAKSQFIFFSKPISDFNATFEQLLEKSLILNEKLTQFSQKKSTNYVFITDDWLDKFQNIGRTLILNDDDLSSTTVAQRVLNSSYITETLSVMYLSEITKLLIFIDDKLKSLNESDVEISKSLNQDDLKLFLKFFEKKSTDVIEIFTYAITEELFSISNFNHFSIGNSFERICNNNTMTVTDKTWIKTSVRTMKTLCKTEYKKYFELIYRKSDELEQGIRYFVETLSQIGDSLQYNVSKSDEWKRVMFDVFNLNSTNSGEFLKIVSKYTYDFDLRGFFQYLNMKLEHYSIMMDFVTGNDWWSTLRQFYNKTYSNMVLDLVENSPKIAEDIINNFPKVKIVRLIKDIKLNSTETLCTLNISDYIPDSTGFISKFVTQLCQLNFTTLYKEIKPIRLAAQIYDDEFITSEKLDDDLFRNNNIKIRETMMELMNKGPQTAMLPNWISAETVSSMKNINTRISTESARIDIIFFALNNVIDAVTLFMNSTSSTPSVITPWIKQINLQLIKKDEYAVLMCDLQNMNTSDIYTILINDFHWDLALSEIISGRNYTWMEMNKSLNQLLENVRHYVSNLDSGQLNKLSKCFFNSSISNPVNKMSLYVMLGSNVMKLIRASSSHFKDIQGFSTHPTWQYLFSIMKNNLPINIELKDVIRNASSFPIQINGESYQNMYDISDWTININKILKNDESDKNYYYEIYSNGSKLNISSEYLNASYISNNIQNFQHEKFWSFDWFANIISAIERSFWNLGHIVQKLSVLDWNGLTKFEVKSVIDFALQMVQKSYAKTIALHMNNIISEFNPLLENFELEYDLKKIATGLHSIHLFVEDLVNNLNLKFETNNVFQNWHRIINETHSNTNLTISTLNTIQYATIDLRPLLNSDSENIHIDEFICKPSLFSTIFLVSKNYNQTTLYETRMQLCKMTNNETITLAMTLLKNVNFTTIFDGVVRVMTDQIVHSSNLTTRDGETVVKSFGNIIELMPTLRQVIVNVSEVLANEPLIKSFQRSTSLSNLLYDPKFFENIGNMMCGKPFVVNTNRFYKVIAEAKDSIKEPDHKQLESLPNDYCRELYQEILKMDGGKILWSYAKPMLMGKILYTPENMHINNIIVHANETFSQIGRLFTLLNEFSSGFSSIDVIMQHNISLFTMQKLLQSSFVKDKFAELFGDEFSSSDFANIDLNNLINSFGNSTYMKDVLTRISSMSRCILLNRFEPLKSEDTLKDRAARLMEVNEFSAGIVFMNAGSNKANIQYKIRMDIDNVPSTSRIKSRFWMPGPNGNFIENLRYFRGFIQLQDMIDRAIIESSDSKNYSSVKERFRRDTINADISKWGIHTQQMPYPCYIQDEFKTILYESQALVIAFFFSLILVVASVVRHLVWERESGNTSLMCVMRMQRKNHTLSWFIASLIEIFITMAVLCIILKFGNILPNSDTIALLLVLFNFGFSVVMFCYMVTSFFKSASLGAVSAVIIYLIFFMPYVIVISLEALLTLPQKIVTSLFMSTGFCYSVLLIARFEVQGIGLQWKNINESPLVDDPISVANTCFIVIFDAFLYFIIGYVINYIRFNDRIHVDVITNNLDTAEVSIGVRIENVTKIYKNRDKKENKALDNVNIDLYKGHITTLLGHNGAGKTTLIKILTGITKPNSGKIIINKQTEVDNVVKNHIGLCPQADILLELMSSREHLIYYARLKTDSNHRQVKYDVESMLEIMGLVHLSEEPVYKLSGGLRRRLSVGLAFIANPHLVILDEPSSGVDPVARRDIWSLIVSLKGNRTILLTTHHLDEAELLSDTLIIMHKGKILTSGSPLELKHKYGSGYNLTVTYPLKKLNNGHLNNFTLEKKFLNNKNADIVNESDYEVHQNSIEEADVMNVNAKDLLNNVREIITNATLDTVNVNSIKINLPFLSNDEQCHSFSSVLQLLEERKYTLKFSNLNMECSSLEQVFLDICKKADMNNVMHDNHKIWDQEITEISSDTNSTDGNIKEDFQKSDASLMHENGILHGSFTEQMLALLKKRFLHYHRNYRVLIITLLLPAIFVAFAMGFSLIRPPDDSEDPLHMSSSLYNKFSAEFVTLQENPMSNIDGNRIIRNIMEDSIKANNRTLEHWIENTRDCKCLDGYQKCIDIDTTNDTILPMNKMIMLPTSKHAIDWMINTQDIYTEKRYGGWSSMFRDSKFDTLESFMVWYNNKGDHALPAYMNTLSNAIFKYKSKDKDAKITTYNHPLKLSQEQLSRSTLLQHVADVGIGVVLLIGFSLVPAGGAIYLVNERTSQEKRLQLLSGVSPFTYWISALLWDVLIIFGAIVLALCVFEIFALPVYLYKENIPAISLLLLLYGISCSTLMHIVEKFFVDASLANMILFCSNVFVGVVGLTILLIIDVLSTSDHMDYVRWALHKVFLIFPQFALGDGLVEISKNTIQASLLSRFGMDTYLSPLGWELMGFHYLSLTLTAILFFSINILYEYHLLDSIFAIFQKENHSSIDMDKEDCDVITEKYRVELATLKPHYNIISISKLDKLQDQATKLDTNDVLQIISLRKVYSGVLENRVAVDSLTFGVKPAQCFGLLGVNGAGKSTTFKMLTGEVKPTDGQIFIAGKLVSQRELCNGLIAYCPQVDSLDRLLTVTEHLNFYASLRGLTDKTKKIKSTLKQFDLLKYSNQQSNTLSGGNKRKLCTAISLMGNSPIVLLDEPTSGMDPGARFNTGCAIKQAIKAGRCLLLSSHSLIECESLCQTVAVTALGKFLAIGHPNYLKQKYGGGYLVSIRLASPNQKGQLIQSMSEMFPQMQVQNSHYCTTQFLVPINNQSSVSPTNCNISVIKENFHTTVVKTQLSDIFRGLSKIDSKLNVIDYSVNQSSLDQVFINFSQHREEKSTPHSKDTNGQINLSTLERQYSKNKDINLCANNETFVTKF